MCFNMKKLYRKINTNLIEKLVKYMWHGTTEYNRNVKKGIELEGGNKDTLREILKYDLEMSEHGVPFETLVEYNPYKFKKIWMNPTHLAEQKVTVSDKCLYSYAYRGKHLEPYYNKYILDTGRIKGIISNSNIKVEISEFLNDYSLKIDIEDTSILPVPELVEVFKNSTSVWVGKDSHTIFVSTQYVDYGYDITNALLRYGVYLFDERQWIDDQQAIDATLTKLKMIEKLSNAPEQFDIESYLMWIGGNTSKKYVNDYMKLLYRINIGGIKWHQEAEGRLKKLELYDKYKGYKVYVLEVFVDPIVNDYALKRKKKIYEIGHDYEKDADMIGLYDPVYKDIN